MVERGAKAICLLLPDVSPSDCVQTHERTGHYVDQPPCSPTNCTPARYARAALLAALDPEDEALVELIAGCISQGHPDHKFQDARDAINAVRAAMTQGETLG